MANRTSQGTVGVIVLANFAETARARAFAHLAFSRYLLPFTPGLTFVESARQRARRWVRTGPQRDASGSVLRLSR